MRENKKHILRQTSWVFFILLCSTDSWLDYFPQRWKTAVSTVQNALRVHARTIAPEHKSAHQMKHDFHLMTQN